MERIERTEPYFVRDEIPVTMVEMAQAAETGVHGSSKSSIAFGLLEICKVSTQKHFYDR